MSTTKQITDSYTQSLIHSILKKVMSRIANLREERIHVPQDETQEGLFFPAQLGTLALQFELLAGAVYSGTSLDGEHDIRLGIMTSGPGEGYVIMTVSIDHRHAALDSHKNVGILTISQNGPPFTETPHFCNLRPSANLQKFVEFETILYGAIFVEEMTE